MHQLLPCLVGRCDDVESGDDVLGGQGDELLHQAGEAIPFVRKGCAEQQWLDGTGQGGPGFSVVGWRCPGGALPRARRTLQQPDAVDAGSLGKVWIVLRNGVKKAGLVQALSPVCSLALQKLMSGCRQAQ